MSFPTPKSIAIEDMKGMTVSSIGETKDGTFIIEFDSCYRLVIPEGTVVKWEKRREV